MIYGHLSCPRIFFLIFNNRKIAKFKGLYDEKKTKAETETYKVQKPVPNTSADLCTLRYAFSFSFCIFSGFRYEILIEVVGLS